MTIQMDGEVEVNGIKIKWDRMSSSGLAIRWNGHDLHIGGEVDPRRFKELIQAYTAGYNYGYGMGKMHKAFEIRKALDVT